MNPAVVALAFYIAGSLCFVAGSVISLLQVLK